jgi:predicted nucleotidyltransferase
MAESEALRDLVPVLASLSRWLNDQQVTYAIIGGVAVGFRAQPRFTQDVDAVVWIDLDQLEAFVESGKRFGFVPRVSDPIDFARKARVLLLRHQQTNIGIDLSCGALPFEREMLDRATELTAGAISLRIATSEDLIILKAVAHRQRDLVDIDNLLTVHLDVDFDRIRYWVRQFADVLDSPELVSDVERILADHNPPAKA